MNTDARVLLVTAAITGVTATVAPCVTLPEVTLLSCTPWGLKVVRVALEAFIRVS